MGAHDRFTTHRITVAAPTAYPLKTKTLHHTGAGYRYHLCMRTGDLHLPLAGVPAVGCQIQQHEANGNPSDKYGDEAVHNFSIK